MTPEQITALVALCAEISSHAEAGEFNSKGDAKREFLQGINAIQ